ncbi:MAG: Mrr restriction system protein [Chitinophagaceae bacterium]
MAKELSPSRRIAAKVIYAALRILKENGGSMRGSDLVDLTGKSLTFTDWEKERYEKTGNIRWESMLHFYSIDSIKAGFLRKDKGTWTITPEGEEALKLDPEALLDKATKAYRSWKSQQPVEAVLQITTPVLSPNDNIAPLEKEITFEQQQSAILEQYEEKAYEGLRQFVLNKNPYEFQDMVAALLASMGYYISLIAKKGRDGGIDIIMYTDPLGTKPPRIIVQVKHRPESTVPSDDIQRLIGTMKRDTDVGIFVTSGDFSNSAKQEARSSGKHIELIDFDRFIQLWQDHYKKMDDKQKNMLPLQPIFFLGVNE